MDHGWALAASIDGQHEYVTLLGVFHTWPVKGKEAAVGGKSQRTRAGPFSGFQHSQHAAAGIYQTHLDAVILSVDIDTDPFAIGRPVVGCDPLHILVAVQD